MNKIMVLLVLSATMSYAENTIPNYGYYDNANEIAAKDRLIPHVSSILDFDTQAQPGRYYIPITYQGGNNGTDTDYIYADELIGKNGSQGTQGVQGAKGDTGAAGRDGTDATIDNHLFLNVGATVRWYDWKYVSFSSGYRYDVHHYENTVDIAMVNIKLFQSYEDRRADALQKRIELLERKLVDHAK